MPSAHTLMYLFLGTNVNLLFNFIFRLSKYNRTEFLNRKGIFIGSWIEIKCPLYSIKT